MQIVRCVIVGINNWADMTGPFVASLKEYNPSLDVVVVDNQSSDPYPLGEGYDLIRIQEKTFTKGFDGYPQALNLGAEDAAWNWLVCCKNALVCEGDILEEISKLSPDTIYGNAWRTGAAVLDTAYLLVPRQIWEDIGPFSVLNFDYYQVHAGLKGYKLDIVTLPLVPYWDIME